MHNIDDCSLHPAILATLDRPPHPQEHAGSHVSGAHENPEEALHPPERSPQ
jgi:hypothetical protein